MNRYSKTQLRRGTTVPHAPAEGNQRTPAQPTSAAEESLLLPHVKPRPGATSLRKGDRK